MIRYLVMDIDGSLTDGKIYMGPTGETMKAFSIKDGYAINFILKPAEILPVVITARTSEIVQKRCQELGISPNYDADGNAGYVPSLEDKIQFLDYCEDPLTREIRGNALTDSPA